MPVRTFVPSTKVQKKPNIPLYVDTPTTLGEHIRKKRIQSKLLQKDVAKLLNVTEDCITYWEMERSTPQVQHYPAIISFLGYYPFDHETVSLGGKLKQIRYCSGFSFKQSASFLQISVDAAMRWERGKPIAYKENKELIEKIWQQLPNRSIQHPL